MTPQEFYHTYILFACDSEEQTKVPALFTLAQAALESGWGEHDPGYNFFGIKDTDGINGNEQLLGTTEYNKLLKKWYYPKNWFRKYNTPSDCFIDHAQFLIKNPRYHEAFKYTDPIEFSRQVALAHYATDPDYAQKIAAIIRMLQKFK